MKLAKRVDSQQVEHRPGILFDVKEGISFNGRNPINGKTIRINKGIPFKAVDINDIEFLQSVGTVMEVAVSTDGVVSLDTNYNYSKMKSETAYPKTYVKFVSKKSRISKVGYIPPKERVKALSYTEVDSGRRKIPKSITWIKCIYCGNSYEDGNKYNTHLRLRHKLAV